jgi:protein-L-isoaspartate(D-aspartate) O-methyltransferase
MVERQLRRRGIGDERVLDAMGTIPRDRFVGERERRRAYNDSALPIGYGQTISQPWIVAAIAQALELRGEESVLDVGSGSGYSAAVLASLAREVIGIERVVELAESSRRVLRELGVGNVEIVAADGSEGLPERAPFGAIAVHATAPGPPRALLEQLQIGGRLVVPVATDRADMLTVYRRTAEEIDLSSGRGLDSATIGATRFVPLIGRAGFSEGA